MANLTGEAMDGRCPRWVRISNWSVDLDVLGAIGEKDLASRQNQHASLIRRVVLSIRSSRLGNELRAVKFEKMHAVLKHPWAGIAEHVAIGQKSSWTVGDIELLAVNFGEIRTSYPSSHSAGRRWRVDCVVTGRSGSQYRSIRPQHRR